VHPVDALPPFARALLGAAVAVWILLEFRQSFKHRPEGVSAGVVNEIVFRLTVVIGALVASALLRWAPGAAIRPAAAAGWTGFGLVTCGIALRLWSFRTLGRYFTFVIQTSADQPVITSGPYRFVRHPSYAGILVIVVSVGLFIGNWLSLLGLTLAVVTGSVFRIRVEEQMLLQSLGNDYRTYAASHKRLIPYVW
jgi:protein-S-isoprenylcysteine O-methyltransferase Ste14